jgi:hypothetical protein
MNRAERRTYLSSARRHIRTVNAAHTDTLVEIPRDRWPANQPDGIVAVFRSRKFLVQLYSAALPAVSRISVSRTSLENSGHWRADIAWEELQEIKNALGFANFDAVEVYPAAADVVNVSNMRHLWILGESLPFAWRSR